MATQSARAISVTAGATIVANTFIDLQADGKFDPCGAADMADGIALEAGVDTDRIPMVVPDGSVVQVVASAAISVGDLVGCAASGQARTAATGDPVMGKALTAAGAAGELIDIQFLRGAVLAL
jgi:hypothetical protein